MSTRKIRVAPRVGWIHSPRLHLVLYSLLLVATPFIFLRMSLIDKIGEISDTKVTLFGHSLPASILAASILLAGTAVYYRKSITRHLLGAIAAAVLLDVLVQQIADFYFGLSFSDLQQNWHYIAYGLFAYMMYRDLKPCGYSTARIMWLTYVIALGYSAFDETFQRYMSARVFDVGDIAKDLWGALMGIVIVHFGGADAPALWKEWRPVRQRRWRDYFTRPVSSLLLMFLFGLLLVCNGSLLSDPEYAPVVAALTIGSFVAAFLTLHLSQFRVARLVLAALLILAIGAQAWSLYRCRGENIVLNRHGLTVYKGVPIPYYDLLIFPDGSFRLVDKKHYFNARDRKNILGFKMDILLIGSGDQGLGGQGFDETEACHFVYNPFTRKATQIIILPTPEACEIFNRLKKEGKSVLFILHNTC